MVQFAESDHDRAMSAYEANCRSANASNQDARERRRDSIEDSLVAGGIEAINEYRKTLNARWEKANCLAEYDGVGMGFAILKRAEERLQSLSQVENHG